MERKHLKILAKFSDAGDRFSMALVEQTHFHKEFNSFGQWPQLFDYGGVRLWSGSSRFYLEVDRRMNILWLPQDWGYFLGTPIITPLYPIDLWGPIKEAIMAYNELHK